MAACHAINKRECRFAKVRHLALTTCLIAFLAKGASTATAEVGLASLYSEQFNGERTASGERYDSAILTAAHRTLPFGTEVKVTNLGNGKSVTVRITDRGPRVKGRIVDLSSRAAAAIGLSKGVTRVRIEVLDEPMQIRALKHSRP
jgi:rare lipoprotein A